VSADAVDTVRDVHLDAVALATAAVTNDTDGIRVLVEANERRLPELNGALLGLVAGLMSDYSPEQQAGLLTLWRSGLKTPAPPRPRFLPFHQEAAVGTGHGPCGGVGQRLRRLVAGPWRALGKLWQIRDSASERVEVGLKRVDPLTFPGGDLREHDRLMLQILGVKVIHAHFSTPPSRFCAAAPATCPSIATVHSFPSTRTPPPNESAIFVQVASSLRCK
jgi:hypothetical protein